LEALDSFSETTVFRDYVFILSSPLTTPYSFLFCGFAFESVERPAGIYIKTIIRTTDTSRCPLFAVLMWSSEIFQKFFFLLLFSLKIAAFAGDVRDPDQRATAI